MICEPMRGAIRWPVATAITALANARTRPGICTMAHWKSVAIIAWQARADGQSAKEVGMFVDLLIGQRALFSIIHVVESTAGLPTPEGRDELVKVARKNNKHVACVGVLMPESHVLATMLRVFVRCIHTLMRGALETVVEDDLASLSRKVVSVHARRTAEQLDPHELARAIDGVRQLPSR
jgi:hypothetical protein